MAIIECKKCGTKYRLSDKKISSKGTKVRCSRCGHVFEVKLRKKKDLNIFKKRFVLLLIFVIIGGSALWIVKNYSNRLSGITSFFKKSEKINIKGVVLEDVKQYFVENEKIGRLLVIEGKVTNRSKTAKRLIKLRATLYDKKGRVVSRKTIFAGNTLSLYQLQLYTQKEIEDALNSKVGIITNNSNILPNKSVSFMIVFYNPSQKVSEFTLQVTQALTLKTPIKTVK